MVKPTLSLSFIYVTLFFALFTPSLSAASPASKTSAEQAAPVPRRLRTQLKNTKVSDVHLLNHRAEDDDGWGFLQQRDVQQPWSVKEAQKKDKADDVVSDGLAADKSAGNGQSVSGSGGNQTSGLDKDHDEQTGPNDAEGKQSGNKDKDSGNGNENKQSGNDDERKQSDDGSEDKQSDEGNENKQSGDGSNDKQSDDGNEDKQSGDGNEDKQNGGSSLQESNPQAPMKGQSWNYPGYPGYQPKPVTGGHLSGSGDRDIWNDLVRTLPFLHSFHFLPLLDACAAFLPPLFYLAWFSSTRSALFCAFWLCRLWTRTHLLLALDFFNRLAAATAAILALSPFYGALSCSHRIQPRRRCLFVSVAHPLSLCTSHNTTYSC